MIGNQQPQSNSENPAWLTSQQAKKTLKINSCALMHLRLSGQLVYKKQGNAFLYQIPAISKQGS
jgi:hypothetical protein